jgi:succinate dehydrogenase/fumarate reductase flavoprotein subunit
MKNHIIIVGAGLAGMVAAIAAHDEGASVTLIDRGSVGLGTNSALSGGLFTGPTFLHSPAEYIRDTLDVGRGINCERLVRLVASKASDGFDFLREMGLNLIESLTSFAVRSSSPEIIPGVTLVRKVAERVRELPGIKVLTGFYVTEVLTAKDQAHGVKGFDKTGKDMTIHCDGVIIATGGAGAIYSKNDNQKTIMGQGYYLAAKAGLKLLDMEFVQCYPLVIAEPHLPSMLVYPPYPHEAKLMNGKGEDILSQYGIQDINDAIMKKRDEFSVILYEESKTSPVLMDFSEVPEHMWGIYPLTVLDKLRFDVRKKPFAVSPAVHFCMGGIEVNNQGQTGLQGLYACGEVIWGIHGANRRGGNALTECVVMGRIAGESAAKHPKSDRRITPQKDGKGSGGVSGKAEPHGSPVSLREIRRRIRDIAWEHAGIVRDEEGITEGFSKLNGLEQELKGASWSNVIERATKEDLLSAVFSLRAILGASLGRKESRGSFIRKDFPKEDNSNWRKNSCLTYDAEKDSFSVTYLDVK